MITHLEVSKKSLNLLHNQEKEMKKIDWKKHLNFFDLKNEEVDELNSDLLNIIEHYE